ncbi:MAG: hypothetical protein KF740_07790 [Ramlibacter sp.]|nr:hypothetical protein [Ramlibacter sp.]
MDLVAMAFFNGVVAFSVLRFIFNISASRHALFLLILLPVGSFGYMVFIPMKILGALAALVGTAVGGVVYMAGTLYPKSDLDLKNKPPLAFVNSILFVAISLIAIYIYPAAKIAEPIQKIFGNIGFNVVIGTILLLSAANIFANLLGLQTGRSNGDIDQ